MLKDERIKWADLVSLLLLVVGGLHLGLVGFFGFDLAAAYFGQMSMWTRVAYGLFGLASLYQIFSISHYAWKGKPKFA